MQARRPLSQDFVRLKRSPGVHPGSSDLSRPPRRTRSRSASILVLLIATTLASVGIVPTATARPDPDSNLTLVPVDSTDGDAHYDHQITFKVKTSMTDRPFVSVDCYQGDTHVYWASAGFFPDYPWPWNQVFTLSSSYWTGGEADCVAKMYYRTHQRFRTLAKLPFHVYA
jgi:hypothetical protein